MHVTWFNFNEMLSFYPHIIIRIVGGVKLIKTCNSIMVEYSIANWIYNFNYFQSSNLLNNIKGKIIVTC